MRTNTRLLSLTFIGLALASGAFAQTATPPLTTSSTGATGSEFFTPAAGEREFTLGGSGMSNKDFDSSSGGFALSLGKYLNESWLISVRQSASYTNPDNAGSSWAGSTRAAFDFHFPTNSRLRPFLGAHVGGIYGGGVSDTFTAGLEAGVKFYVLPRTFIYAMADYAWAFDESDKIEDTFNEGGYQWNVGIGYNF